MSVHPTVKTSEILLVMRYTTTLHPHSVAIKGTHLAIKCGIQLCFLLWPYLDTVNCFCHA